jgi:hypothetical protein
MKFFLLLSIFACSLASFSQSTEWTKEERNSIYDECLNGLTKYKSITNNQKDSISLCCLEEITKKYTKKDYHVKMDAERKSIQDLTAKQCGKNRGIDLNVTSNNLEETKKSSIEKSIFKKEDFNGHWTFETGLYSFYSIDGKFIYKNPAYKKEARGKWYLNGKNLILEDTKSLLKWASVKYEIVSVYKEEIVLMNLSTKKICSLKKNH